MVATEIASKRTRLIQAAIALAYRHGFRETRLADIAAEAKVPPGNVYYYFKTKEEIGAAIVHERLSQIKMFHRKLDGLKSPQERLCAFVQMTVDNREILAKRGCPIGSLCTELHKENGLLAKESTVLFAEILAWLKAQFEALGKGADSKGLAVHLLAALQGIAVLAHSLNDPDMVVIETGRLQRWIRTLTTKKAQE
jgi:TetR/AcrR family transcriptional regulator, transcriptional repressor for nem operon